MTASASTRPPGPPSVRLFNPSQCLGGIGDLRDLRLREAADLLYFPSATHLDPDSISLVRTTLANWERLTFDPPIGAIDDDTLIRFRDSFLADTSGGFPSGRSPATVAANLRRLKTIFRFFGPRSDGNPGGRGILEIIPHCRGFKCNARDWQFVSIEDMQAVYLASEIATWPSEASAHPCHLWRGMWAWQWAYGMNATADMLPTRWDAMAPGIKGRKERPEPDRLYLEFLRDKTAADKPELVLPVPDWLQRILRPLQTGGERIFDFSMTNFRDRNAQRDEILQAAGIPKERWFTFADLRPTCSTRLNDLTPGLGAAVLGHAPRGVNSRFYDLWASRMADGLDQLPLPPAFLGNERQLRLFG